MNKEEFLKKLEDSLVGHIKKEKIDENIDFYKSHIENEILSGRFEKDIIKDLGDPRLLAKTIIEVYNMNKHEENYNSNFKEETIQNNKAESNKHNQDKFSMLKVKLTSIIVLVIFLLIIIVFASFMFKLLRILFVPLLLIFVVRSLLKTFK